ncbi:MAG: efflux RND transporter periplasmic adaptor subunit [Pirellulales bacterium]
MSTTLDSSASLPSSAALPAHVKAGPRLGARLIHGVPNLLVFALLAGVFYVGHRTHWQLPKVSQLFVAAAAAPDDWCVEHLVPDSQCVECKPDLLPRAAEFGFCATHGVTECVLCHPELAQSAGEPRMPQYDTAAALTLVTRPENNSRNTLHKGRVQFATTESAGKAGLDVDVVQERPMSEAVVANGDIRFDPTRVAHLSSRAGGTVAVVFKQVGDAVRSGDVLAVVDAVEISQAKSKLLHAIVQRDARRISLQRLQAAGEGVAAVAVADASAARQEAEVALISARQTLVNLGLEVPDNLAGRDPAQVDDELRFLGIAPEVLRALPAETRSANLLALRAPHDGVIVAAEVVAGEVVDPTDVLFTVADPSHMWLTLHVRQEDARYVAPGQEVVFRTDSSAQRISGQISWISPTIDPRTRTLEARVVLDNTDGRLKDNTFGTGDIVLRHEPKAVVVPRVAVQATPDAKFVFVRDRNYLQPDAPKVFHPRQVRLGAHDDQFVELLAGVLPGEVVVTEGSNVLLSQLQRSNLGAGCGCHEK